MCTRNNKTMKKILLPALVAVLLSACNFVAGKRVKGNGHVVTVNRNPGSFTEVAQKGSFDLVLKPGSQAGVQIDAEENIAQHIETSVDNGRLVVQTEDGFFLRPTRKIRIVVTAPSFEGIRSMGSGNIETEGRLTGEGPLKLESRGSGNIKVEVKVPELEAETTGSGNITVSGEAPRARFSTMGSGDLDAANLQANEVDVAIRGSGNASVNAVEKLALDIKGSGDVRYRGNPSIRSDIRGSGSLQKAD